MIFTLGFRSNYDDGIKKYGAEFQKMGKCADFQGKPYAGGSVWRSRKEVNDYLETNQPRLAKYAAYGVLADWNADTEQLPGEPFRRLLKDAQIVGLD